MYPDSSEKRLLFIGRLATIGVMVVGFLWIPFLQELSKGTLYQYLQNIQAYIAPPITAVFLLGILWKRTTSQGAITTLLLGIVLAITRIVAELSTDATSTGLMADYAAINFSHLAIYLFMIYVVVCVVVSLLTTAPNEENIRGLTFGTLTKEQKASAKDSYNIIDIIASLMLIAVVIGVMVYFTG